MPKVTFEVIECEADPEALFSQLLDSFEDDAEDSLVQFPTYVSAPWVLPHSKFDRVPRGAKSVEHLKVLRQSNPCYGSLAPKADRPSLHEVSYDPLTRWNVLAKSLAEPRGAKSLSHMEVLRQSNPALNSLAPSILRYLPMVDESSEFSTLEQLRTLRAEAADGTVSLEAGGWKLLAPAKKSFNFDSFDEYTDDESSESGDGVSELPPGLTRFSTRDTNTSEDSERSNARTLERMSNDSCSSFLDDEFPELPSPGRRSRSNSHDLKLPTAEFKLPPLAEVPAEVIKSKMMHTPSVVSKRPAADLTEEERRFVAAFRVR